MLRPVATFIALLAMATPGFAQPCGGDAMGVQVLGSGGPRINRERASTSYLVWLGGQGRILIDAGGGAFLRFGQAGGQLESLSLVAISHLHPDHVSDLPALLWLSNLARKEPLRIAGPSGGDVTPDFGTFLSRLFDDKSRSCSGATRRARTRSSLSSRRTPTSSFFIS
jgi:ribonuclease BN (tRNA processing enzyme)